MIAPTVFTDDEQRRLLDACRGSSFEDRRDVAILRSMLDTGMRRGEVAAMKVELGVLRFFRFDASFRL